MFIVGLGHKKGVGKDTFAQFLRRHFSDAGLCCEILSISNPLINAAHTLFGWAGFPSLTEMTYDYSLKDQTFGDSGIVVRDILKKLGTFSREFDELSLLKQVIHNAEARAVDVAIITNIRFPDEAHYVKTLGGHLYKIRREAAPNDVYDEFDTALDSYDDWDQILRNDGTLDMLNIQAKGYAKIIHDVVATRN